MNSFTSTKTQANVPVESPAERRLDDQEQSPSSYIHEKRLEEVENIHRLSKSFKLGLKAFWSISCSDKAGGGLMSTRGLLRMDMLKSAFNLASI